MIIAHLAKIQTFQYHKGFKMTYFLRLIGLLFLFTNYCVVFAATIPRITNRSSEFDERQTKQIEVSKKNLGGQIVAYAVVPPGDSPAAFAKACVDHYTQTYRSAFCRVFVSQQAFNFSKSGATDYWCYVASYGKNIDGAITEVENRDPLLLKKQFGCPLEGKRFTKK
ncbi:MAG: hypothetical protein EOO46_16025 [Flavobacterium sp.]|nr:MAG: hypothetical protein EOO46_16025 [Flavobacterium sp.]